MIELKSITEIYYLKFFCGKKLEEKKIYALKNVSLSISQGEMVNIIGENGSGKTTLLKIITRLIDPTEGEINIKGRTGVIMDIGCGFHPDLTGRENLIAAAPLYGMTDSELIQILPEIEEFADLGVFFDAPVRTYSHGMYLRLAFSFAVSFQPDILCIDDIITVGDEKVRHRCLEKIETFRRLNKTILLVTHDLHFAKDFAKRTIWMKGGQVCLDGETEMVLKEYVRYCKKQLNIHMLDHASSLYITRNDQHFGLHLRNLELCSLEEIRLDCLDLKRQKKYKNSSLKVLEWSRLFIRFQFELETLHVGIQMILSILEGGKIVLEFFLENPKLQSDLNFRFRIFFPWKTEWNYSSAFE